MSVYILYLQLILISGLIQTYQCTTTPNQTDPLEETSTNSFLEPTTTNLITTTEPILIDDLEFNIILEYVTQKPSLMDILVDNEGRVYGENEDGFSTVNPEDTTTAVPVFYFESNAIPALETNPTGGVISVNVDQTRTCCRYVLTKTSFYRCIPIDCYPNRANFEEATTTEYSSLGTTMASGSQESTHPSTAEEATLVYDLLNSSTEATTIQYSSMDTTMASGSHESTHPSKEEEAITSTDNLFNNSTLSMEATNPNTTDEATKINKLFHTTRASPESTNSITTEPSTAIDDS